jgi:hypothetical protein
MYKPHPDFGVFVSPESMTANEQKKEKRAEDKMPVMYKSRANPLAARENFFFDF